MGMDVVCLGDGLRRVGLRLLRGRHRRPHARLLHHSLRRLLLRLHEGCGSLCGRPRLHDVCGGRTCTAAAPLLLHLVGGEASEVGGDAGPRLHMSQG